ncbi:hypothetical protein ATERTT37_002252 [Aspergillus terreus]
MGPLIVASDQQSADSPTVMGTPNPARTNKDNCSAATLSTCLRDSIEACGGSLQPSSLDDVVQTMQYVDELNKSTLGADKQNFHLPDIKLAERCIPAYFANIHLRYPVMERQIFFSWRDFYKEDAYTLDAFLALSEGRPVAIYDKPSDVDQQGLEFDECPPNLACVPATRIYRWNLELALIVNRTCRILNQDNTNVDLPSELADIDNSLLSWRDSIPMEFRPEQENVSRGLSKGLATGPI